ncbi:hypothetical protein GCM10009836_21740 [Pseudonocardia ailaonensis]|uniref:Secreted protein n=1 Tax=Pseudonocardia ailaonensis TaxID=367279 RepID=A0ABN2MXB9_9PSEU
MLKKVALIAAASAASVVALSPLAFASETGINKASEGLFNASANDVNVPIQACNNDVPVAAGALVGQVNAKDITGAATGALGILGSSKAKTDVHTDSDRSCGQVSGAGDSVN